MSYQVLVNHGHNASVPLSRLSCVKCLADEIVIGARASFLMISKMTDEVIDKLADPINDGETTCLSCSVETGRHCVDCGLSEVLMSEYITGLDEDQEFIVDESEWPKVPRCPECYNISIRYSQSIMDSLMITCDNCNRTWDGQAQCPCGL